ncbi:MAG: NUDIX hydrolase [Beijerinckiaceae bacterium]|nr:NUDIX hydrolase [Beijerinckiaceae bacterium]
MIIEAAGPIATSPAQALARRFRPRGCPRRPYLAVSAAVFRSGRVLLAKRVHPPFAGAFSLPGGLVELGETLEEAALRELREEVQIDARIFAFNRHVEFVDCDAVGKVRRHYVIASFACEWLAGEAQPGPEADETLWAVPDSLGGLNCTPHLASVVEAAQKLFASSVLDARG